MSAAERQIGYHCSHEQYAPGELLALARAAEAAGFDAAMCSDHFAPWTGAQGHSGATWPWLGAALEATRLSFGTVSAPGYRYHPAVLAQAAATLSAMYPERLWLALGSGEALNEHIATTDWPPKPARNERLRRCAAAIRALWAGEAVTDPSIGVFDARLYDRPAHPPLLAGAALTAATAEWLGGWADALITTAQDRETMQSIVEAFRRGGGEGKPMFLQAVISYAEDDETALDAAHEQWRALALGSDVLATLRSPREFEAASAAIPRELIREKFRVSSDPGRHTAWLEEDFAMGFSRVYLHNVHRAGQHAFIDTFGREILPRVGN
ncbi:MAG TPA: TIGR03885 family FMN-dependent LLM class oxidoreductase [Thermoanaerobaculia bacterium]|nr:TIGR03885 family FMN-dependent LLM class oxidoreductase [Thermoanaerobaculia bacterium]